MIFHYLLAYIFFIFNTKFLYTRDISTSKRFSKDKSRQDQLNPQEHYLKFNDLLQCDNINLYIDSSLYKNKHHLLRKTRNISQTAIKLQYNRKNNTLRFKIKDKALRLFGNEKGAHDIKKDVDGNKSFFIELKQKGNSQELIDEFVYFEKNDFDFCSITIKKNNNCTDCLTEKVNCLNVKCHDYENEDKRLLQKCWEGNIIDLKSQYLINDDKNPIKEEKIISLKEKSTKRLLEEELINCEFINCIEFDKIPFGCENKLYEKIENEKSTWCSENYKKIGYFFDRTQNPFVFSPCDKSCINCEFESKQCIKCNTIKNYYPLSNDSTKCYTNITEVNKYYFNKINKIFEECSKGCLKCNEKGDDSNTKCIECNTDEYYYPLVDVPNNCFTNQTRPNKYYFDDSTKKFEICSLGCLKCNEKGDDSNTKCIQCDMEIFYYPLIDVPNNCFTNQTRPNKYYLNNNQFDLCYSGCLICNELGEEQDSKCKESKCNTEENYYPLFDYRTKCFKNSTKPNKYYLSEKKIFEACSIGCLTCNEKGNSANTKCTKCDSDLGTIDENYYPLGSPDATHCIFKSEKPTNYFLDEENKFIDKCNEVCKTCQSKGPQMASQCDKFQCIDNHYPLEEMPSSCFNNQTVPSYYFWENNLYIRCFAGCKTCHERGVDVNMTNCDSCDSGYAFCEDFPKRCANESTKPNYTNINPDGIYQTCYKNILCENECINSRQRWYINITKYINCIDGLICNDYCPLYYSSGNRCYHACPDDTYADPLTNYCIRCDSDPNKMKPENILNKQNKTGVNRYLYENSCHSKCPDGKVNVNNKCVDCTTEANYIENGKCTKQCSSGQTEHLVCNPCAFYYSNDESNSCVEICPENQDYDENKKCFPKTFIDPRINLIHNPVNYLNDIYWYYNNQTISTDPKEILKKVLNAEKVDINPKKKANYFILFARMVHSQVGSATVREIEVIYIGAIKLYIEFLDSQMKYLPYDDSLNILLADYYLLINEKYINQEILDLIKKAQKPLFNILINFFTNSTDNFLQLNAKKDEVLSITSVIIDIISNYQNTFNLIDPDFNPSLFNNLYHRIERTFLSSESRLLSKQLTEDYAVFSYRIKSPMKQSTETIDMIALPLEYLQHISGFPLQSIPTCMNDQEELTKMRDGNIFVQVCIPKIELVQKYPQALFISIIEYRGQYPLFNKNATEISSKFISVNLYSNTYEKIPINSLAFPIKIYVNKINSENKNYSYCLYYDENEKKPGINVAPRVSGDYIICESKHLTDFGFSILDVEKAMSEDNLMYSYLKIINSFEVFALLNFQNIYIVYIFCGFIGFFLLFLIFSIPFDIKNYKHYFFDIIKRVHHNIEDEEHNISNDGLRLILAEIDVCFPDNAMKNLSKEKEIKVDIQEETAKKKLSENYINSAKKIDMRRLSVLYRVDINQKQNKCVYWQLFKLFLYYEYRPFVLFSLRKSQVNKTDLCAIFCLRKMMLLAFAGMGASCQLKILQASKFIIFPMDYAVIFGGVILADILCTLFEILLGRRPIEDENTHHFKRRNTNGTFAHILFYLLFMIIVGFGILNTLWVTLEIEKQELVSMMSIDFVAEIVFDLLIYEMIILNTRAVLYYILLMNLTKKTNCLYYIREIPGWLPWMFEINWII